jgi:hypothetical protein
VGRGFKSQLCFVAPTPPFGSKARKTKVNFASQHFIAMMKQLNREVVSSGRPSSHRRYIMDHAKQHASKASSKAMRSARVQLVEGFPAQCRDINIIENVWGVLDSKLLGCRARTPEGWRRGVLKAWDAISQTTIDKLVASVPTRIGQVVEKGGGWLKDKK